jgi:hypothetical protein
MFMNVTTHIVNTDISVNMNREYEPKICQYHYYYYFSYLFIFSGSAAQHRLWPPRSRGFVITHNDAPQSVGLLWMSDQLFTETST